MRDSNYWQAWICGMIAATIAFILLIVFCFPKIGGAATIAVRFTAGGDTCEDAMGIQNVPTRNYGATIALEAKSTATLRRHVYLKWDLSSIPANAHVVSATCSLYVETNTGDGDNYFGCITESWIEGTGDNTSPPHDACSWTYRQEDELSWSTGGGTVDFLEDTVNITETGWVMAEVDSAIQRLVNESGYGVMVAPAQGGTIDNVFTASEGTAAQRPILNVIYTIPRGNSILDEDGGLLGGGILR